MTEAEWLAEREVPILLKHTNWRSWDRKPRLFACACCWRIRHLFRDDADAKILRASELWADGLIESHDSLPQRIDERQLANLAHPPTSALAYTTRQGSVDVVCAAGFAADSIADTQAAIDTWQAVRVAEEAFQIDLLRDIFGNPFRPVMFSTEWRTTTVLALANHLYESRNFDAMPILADALQDAGCNNDDILNHCRDEKQVHVRGCWVVDHVLGKS